MTTSQIIAPILANVEDEESRSVVPIPVAPSTRDRVSGHLVAGASTLGAAVLVERGAGFLANILAARFGGAGVFGAYSLGISTANNISTYAAGGIGATATRFSGKYNDDNGGYARFAHVLALVALVSALVAAIALVAGARPIADLLHKAALTPLLRWAALSAAGMIVVESARGFFVGQHRLVPLALLSVLIGGGMILFVPAIAATHEPTRMIIAQGSITLLATAICLLFAKPLGLTSRRPAASYAVSFSSMLREVWGFGLVQLSGLLSANLAGWWLTALVARADSSLVQMGFFAIASQVRNLIGIVPGLLTESSYALMAGSQEDADRIADRVMALCTFASTTASFLMAGLGAVVLPWLLHALYGARYAHAGAAAAIGMGVATLQMGNSPTSARVSILSVRWIAICNSSWAIFVAIVGSALLLHGGTAAGAMAVFFLAHLLLAMFILAVLRRKGHLVPGLVSLFLLSSAGIATVAILAWWRSTSPQSSMSITLVMFCVVVLCAAGLYLLGRRHQWLIALEHPARLAAGILTRLTRKLSLVTGARHDR